MPFLLQVRPAHICELKTQALLACESLTKHDVDNTKAVNYASKAHKPHA